MLLRDDCESTDGPRFPPGRLARDSLLPEGESPAPGLSVVLWLTKERDFCFRRRRLAVTPASRSPASRCERGGVPGEAAVAETGGAVAELVLFPGLASTNPSIARAPFCAPNPKGMAMGGGSTLSRMDILRSIRLVELPRLVLRLPAPEGPEPVELGGPNTPSAFGDHSPTESKSTSSLELGLVRSLAPNKSPLILSRSKEEFRLKRPSSSAASTCLRLAASSFSTSLEPFRLVPPRTPVGIF
mmetsp:Transcript_24295/g.76471  ORF Transcript_24295/g.76471 Transcript_24295/m.76471 type:complete len:243 (-) Transcript_24295:2631-3359(-)